MSVKLSAYVWDGCAASGIKGVKLLVLARLADFSSDEGISWPGIETIARQIGAGRSSVTTAITQLQEEGWLTRHERRKGNRNNSNMYQLNVAKLRKAAAEHYAEASDSEHSKSEHSESERSKSEHSGFEHSKSEHSENCKKPPFDPSESGGDPLDKNTDPSDKKKPTCRPAAQTDREVEITDFAKRVLKHLNTVTCSRYQVSKTSLEHIRARLGDGFTADELELTVDYLNAKWAADQNMSDYLRPTTMFQPTKFPGYLSSAQKWVAAGRPERVNGKWEDAAFRASYANVDYSQKPEGFR